ncbi:MAG: formylglycine-generating enzyme family protein [Gemmataceae bacterium]|nr:formylglycine-generating enzyme family protein [Gemmataceae bacterium]
MKTATQRSLTCLLALTLSGLFVVAQPGNPGASRAEQPDRVLTNSLGMKLALIPAGKFLMGSPPDEAERDAGELQHEVTITKPFYLGVYEVTQREYHQVMGLLPPPIERAHFDATRGGSLDHPMENVRWTKAVEFCKRLSERSEETSAGRRYRLPTEAEWEYACRAGTTTAFHYGQALSAQQANFNGSFPYGGAEKGPYLRQTTKVGSYAPNAFGLYDMHGNVWEWCSDWYDPDYYRHSPREDPQGPPKGVVPTGYKDSNTPGYGLFYQVIRGGCWIDEARACRSAYRFRAMPNDPYRLIGLRVVCEVAAR